jgi:hypothetical protein
MPCSVQAAHAAAIDRLVLDVVVDQKGVVEHLDRGRDQHRIFAVPTESAAGGDAQRRAQALAAARGVLAHQAIQTVDRTTLGNEP